MRRVLFLIILLCLVGPKPAFPAKQAGKLAVKSALVTEYATGKTLYSQDADRRIPPASLTKVMTMYLVFDLVASGKASFSDRIKVSRRADSTGGSTMGLRAGEVVTLEELMRGMAVASGNDACIAVAEHFGGVPHWVDMMNRKARALGMTGTTFKNPNGLPASGQLTTARDLTKLAVSYLHHYPQALRYHSTTEINHNGAVHGNTNRLLGSCDGVDGIKTGYVDASGYNIIATAKRGNARVIAVVLGGRTKQVRNREATRILDASFAGSIDSMVAACDVPELAPAKHIAKHGRKGHHGKALRVANAERHSKVSARRGASGRFDSGEVSAKPKRSKSSKAAKADTSRKKSHSQGKRHKKNGASDR